MVSLQCFYNCHKKSCNVVLRGLAFVDLRLDCNSATVVFLYRGNMFKFYIKDDEELMSVTPLSK